MHIGHSMHTACVRVWILKLPPPHTHIDAMHFCIQYLQYVLYLILETDTVEEVHCEASPLSCFVPNLNLITTVGMVYTEVGSW